MSSSSGAEETLITTPHEQQANAPVPKTMDAKLMLATGSGDVQQLKDLVNKQQEQDPEVMLVVTAKKQAASSVEKPQPQQGNMDPHLLALASSGSSEKLKALLNGEDSQASGHGTEGSMTTRGASSYGEDTEANESILEGVTAEGDTALHVVAACGHGDNFFTRQWCRCLTTTYGDGDNFLQSACIIYKKAKHLLFVQNNKGNTPLHGAARAGKSKMVACLIEIAEGEDRMEELLRKENKHKETALSEAVRVGNKDIVDLLIGKDSELASYPEDGGASPMYLAIMLKQDEIVKRLYDKCGHGRVSFSGPNGQNALHAAVLRYGARDFTKLLEWNKTHLCPLNNDLTTQRDENGSTPLHFAAAIESLFGPSSICRQVLEANPDALYQPDHAGFFPIHVAASVGAFWNVRMFVTKCPGTASLRDANGRTFLHVAVEKRKVMVVWSACRILSLSWWIMNMVDNDGNTALHLAVEKGSLQMFCPLLANPQVNLNLPNSRGETPLDIAEYRIPKRGLYKNQSSETQICMALTTAGAVNGVHRKDHLAEDNKTVRVKTHDESKEMEVLKDSMGTLCIGSVLIATVTFGATFAVPGGYIPADGKKKNEGSPVLAPRYYFDAFMVSNALAFVSSMMATIGVMYSGTPMLNPRSRKFHLSLAKYLLSISITCLAAAFAFGAFVVLAPVSHKTAAAIYVLSFLILLYKKLEFIGRPLLLVLPLWTRKGLIRAGLFSISIFVFIMVIDYWTLLFIFLWPESEKPALFP